ncbi:MAG: hypothetical protein L6R36_005237 [Xanthoria steineri]|nr:MAG: hypothetical protein L6R36_005237 [Xanthoria steineri]
MISHPAFIATLGLSFISTFAHASPLQPRDRSPWVLDTRAVPDYTSKGCYTEATTGRALTGNAYFDSLMTVEKCAAACSRFSLFGVEYGRECYCGDSLNEGSVPASEDSCSFNCPGNPDEKCGAGNRLNVYERLATAPPTPPTPSTYTSEGCYTEATRGRALSGKTYYDDAMTTAKCATACTGFDLFGLEYYRECYCGNKLQPGSVSTPSNECYHPCTGDKNEICGGDNRLNLYTFGSGTTVTPPVSTPKDYTFDGCFTEATSGRALTGSVYYDNAMTVEKCAAICKAFTLFGLEYGRECYCGNSLQAGSEKTLESQCNFPCPGNDAESCGAGNRLDVYHFGPATTTATTSVSVSTSSSASTSTLSATSTESSTESSATSSETPTSTEVSATSTESSTTSSETTTSTDVSITSTETLTTSTATPTSTEVSVTSIENSATSSETPTSTEASSTSSEISSTSTEISITSTESSATSTESSATSSEITTSTEVSVTSTETLTASTSTPTSTGDSVTSSAISTSTEASSTSTSTQVSVTSSETPTSIQTSTSSTMSSISSTTSSSTSSTMTSISSTTSSSTSTSTSSVCTPSPTQVVINPSFEQDLDKSGKYAAPWTFTGSGSSSVQTSSKNGAQSYDGDHFALLSGVPQSTTSLSQTINTLVAGKTYTLQYFYDLPGARIPFACEFTVAIRGQTVDSFTSATLPSGSYTRRSVTYQNLAAGPAVLSFTTICPRSANPNQSNLALDAITLVTVPATC